MKKIVLLAGCLSILIVGFINVSCAKWNGCQCTYTYQDGSVDSEKISAEEVKDQYGVKNCSALETKITGHYIKKATCKKY